MKLVRFNDDLEFKKAFETYILQLKTVKNFNPNEDYYSMYKPLLEDYNNILKFINSSSLEKYEKKQPYVRFYWFINSENKIIGTIRYRINLPEDIAEEMGNIGYEISPDYIGMGFGKKMLNSLIQELKKENIDKVSITMRQDNISSIKIVEANNGIFKKEVYSKMDKKFINKYEIRF